MSNALDPTDTVDYVLDQNRGKENPPTLVFRFITCREFKQVSKLFQAADAITTNEADHIDACLKALRIPLTGWRNYGGEYSPDDLDSVLSYADVVELRSNLLNLLSVGEMQRKNSARQSLTGAATSVPTAGTANTK